MKKIIYILSVILLILTTTSCSSVKKINVEPEILQMKAICELATMKCYYHNVAMCEQKDVKKFLWWSKDMKFWMEYSGEVTVGIDASLISLDIKEDIVSITMPSAKVLDCEVDKASLTKDSYVVDKDSVKITAADEKELLKTAQEELQKETSTDTVLLNSAQEAAQKLLEGYVNSIGEAVGKEYTITWIYVDQEGNPVKGIDE